MTQHHTARKAPAKGASAREAKEKAAQPRASTLHRGARARAESSPFKTEDLAAFRVELLALRDRLNGKVVQLRTESLTRDDEVNPEEDGTDAFERLFSLERASSDQDIIFNIDEALRAIDEGRYGMCESCGCRIERARLKALPFAKNCIQCQSEMERGRGGAKNAARRMLA